MDIRYDNPVGRVPDFASMRTATATLGSRWRIGRKSGSWGGDVALRPLDSLHAITLNGTVSAEHRVAAADFVHRAIARGTFVDGLADEGLRAVLDPALATHIPRTPVPGQFGELAWDARAVDQRRAALRPLMGAMPSISAILVSRRPDVVAQMVDQIARQIYPDVEIVVAMHGCASPAGLAAVAGHRHLVVLEIDSDVIFGDALNRACDAASGTLLSKVDDDDYIGPHHLWDLAGAHRYSGATLVGKAGSTIYLEVLDTTVRRTFGSRESFTRRVAGSTMTIAAEDLRAVGGWKPVSRAVDTQLLASVAENQGTVYQPHDLGYLYVRGSDPHAHTWQANTVHFLRNARQQWIGLLRHRVFGTAPLEETT